MKEVTLFRSKKRCRTVALLFYKLPSFWPLRYSYQFFRIDDRRYYIIFRIAWWGVNFYWDGWMPRFGE